MNNKIFPFLMVFIMSISCINDHDEITDISIEADNFDLQLEWITNKEGNQPKSLIDADLELELYQGDQLIMNSNNSDQFERLILTNQLDEGTYTIFVNYFSGIKPVSYKLFSDAITDFNICGKIQDGFEGTQIPVARLIVHNDSLVLKPLKDLN